MEKEFHIHFGLFIADPLLCRRSALHKDYFFLKECIWKYAAIAGCCSWNSPPRKEWPGDKRSMLDGPSLRCNPKNRFCCLALQSVQDIALVTSQATVDSWHRSPYQ